MKTLLFAVLIVACFATLQTKEENGQIKFNLDVHKESPIGVYLEGTIDPRQESNNKIQAFIKIANKYIPFLESLASSSKELKYERYWYYRNGAIDIEFYWYFQLIIGWRVQPGAYSQNFYEVTYTPYIWGGTYGEANGTAVLISGATGTGVQYIFAYAPIGVTLYREGKACFGGDYTIMPVALRTDVYVSLVGAQAEILDEIINGIPIHLDFNFTPAENFTLYDINFTDPVYGELIPEICIDF